MNKPAYIEEPAYKVDKCVKRPHTGEPPCVGEPPQLKYLQEEPSKPSYSLPPSRASLRTESLERPPSRPRRQRPTISGRCSAEPQENFVSQHLQNFSGGGSNLRPVTSISELDLRNIDPDIAASLLQQIEFGADMEPILLQLKNSQYRDAVAGRGRAEKMVTFKESGGAAEGVWDNGCV